MIHFAHPTSIIYRQSFYNAQKLLSIVFSPRCDYLNIALAERMLLCKYPHIPHAKNLVLSFYKVFESIYRTICIFIYACVSLYHDG